MDGFADSPDFTRQSKMLRTLYIRGRHNYISTITATQKFNALHPIIRVKATELFVYNIRNMKDLETFIDEVSAVLDKKTWLEMYHTATTEPYSFVYVKLTAKNHEGMFLFQNFIPTTRHNLILIKLFVQLLLLVSYRLIKNQFCFQLVNLHLL
jgi:hypothetical protein